MKKIFLILGIILSLNLVGQDKIVFDSSFVKQIDDLSINWIIVDSIFISFDTLKPPSIEQQIEWAIGDISSFRFLWDIYSEECYNDSVEVVWFWMQLLGKTDLYREGYDKLIEEFGDDSMPYLYSTYEHKEPTFEGFMEWLKEKSKITSYEDLEYFIELNGNRVYIGDTISIGCLFIKQCLTEEQLTT